MATQHPAAGVVQRCTCTQCGSRFANAWSLSTHLRRVHQTPVANRSFPCLVCGNFFATASKLARHRKITKHEEAMAELDLTFDDDELAEIQKRVAEQIKN
jgi:hypothetical protein